MATISSYMAKEYLNWIMGEQGNPVIPAPPPKPIPVPAPDLLDLKVGPVEAALVGGAVLLGQNPKVSRRFWGRS